MEMCLQYMLIKASQERKLKRKNSQEREKAVKRRMDTIRRMRSIELSEREDRDGNYSW